MKLQLLKNNVVPVVIVSVLTFITLSTSVMAASKILGSFGQGAVKSEDAFNLEVKDEKAAEGTKEANLSIPTSTQKINTQKTISTPLKTSLKSTTRVVNSSPTPILNNGNSNSSNCIVTVFGKQYDVTSLISTHSGGNIFSCGTDMSTTYQSHHGTNVSLIASYLVTNSGSSPQNNVNIIPTSNPTSAPTSVPTSAPASNSSNCIVTIFGKQYDVTSLVNTHSGGNIFNCGTDMSATYQSHHGTNVSLIAPYLVTSTGGSSPTGISNPPVVQPTVSIGRTRHDDDDD